MNAGTLQNRMWLNVVLFMMLAGGILFFINKNQHPEPITRLSSLDRAQITRILIPKDNGSDIVFHKNKQGIWQMARPYAVKAHQFRINTLLKLSQAPVQTRYNTDTLKLSDYALDPPRARIRFNDTEIAFGKINPLNNQRYLLAENTLNLISDTTYPLVNAQASSFVDLSLIPENTNITKIHTPYIDIQLSQEKRWQSQGTNTLNADQIQSLIQSWQATQAFAIHKPLERKNLGEIRIYTKTDVITFIITDDDPWLILSLPALDIEYHLDKALKNTLLGIQPIEAQSTHKNTAAPARATDQNHA